MAENNNKKSSSLKKLVKKEREILSPKEKAFCRYYVETGSNGLQAVTKAGYKLRDMNSATTKASILLHKKSIMDEIERLYSKMEKSSIMTAQEVMEHFTAIARGEEKDQFGLDIGASDRIKALVELAKRTVDIENRIAGKPDAKVEIKLDWKRED